jgi:hypothetical protein
VLGDLDKTAKGDYAANAGDLSSAEYPQEDTGVSYHKSTVRAADITDGLSNEYLVGEKYLDPDYYETGESGGDDSIYWGGNCDSLRSTFFPPLPDQSGNNDGYDFGSAHPGALNMALCDRSVRTVSYMIEREIHRGDGKPLDGGNR